MSKLEILIRELLKRDWRQKWVVYPIPSSETMKTMMKWSRIILYQIEAPLDVRLARAKAKDVDISEFIKTTANFEQRMVHDNNLTITHSFSNNYETHTEFF